MNIYKEARKKAGLTQRQIYELYDIPVRTIQDWEGGKAVPRKWAANFYLAELKRISQARLNNHTHN